MINFAIYHGGDIQPTGNLVDAYLLKNSGTFTFTLTGTKIWSEADIRHEAVFGFGTKPEGRIVVAPEPSAVMLALLGSAALLYRIRRHRHGPPPRLEPPAS